MKLLSASAIIIFFLFSTMIVEAGESIPLSPDGSHSNQNQINEALMRGNVHLNAGVYTVDNTIVMQSDRILSGDSGAIIQVYLGTSQWFTGSTGIISCTGSVSNVEICGFQITGNCANLNPALANTPGHDKDCQKCIILHGGSGDYAQNIKIHDMTLFDSFSDGVYIYYANNVHISNIFISNCQHEGVFWSCINNGLLENCQIAGICSDCARLDNSQNCKVTGNIFFSYNGTHANGQYMHGENGIQVGDATSSHGFAISSGRPTTANIEISNNTFANNGLEAIKADTSKPNVYIHDNKFIGESELKTMGVPVGDLNGSFNETNHPTKETSEKVFSSIFDILRRSYAFQYPLIHHDFKASATVTYCNDSDAYSLIEVTGKDIEVVKVEYAGKSVRYFYDQDMWSGELGHVGNETYLPGNYKPDDLKITVYGGAGYQKVEKIEVKESTLVGAGINPDLFIFCAILAVCFISIARNLRRMF